MTWRTQDADGRYYHRVLEQQIIIRFPPDIAEQLNRIMPTEADARSDTFREICTVRFRDSRHADVTIFNQQLKGTLVSLPTYVESHRTVDQMHLFKSADISEMLIVHRAGAKLNIDSDFVIQSGLTPPTSGIVERRQVRREAAKGPEDDVSGIKYWEMVEIQLSALLSKESTAKPVCRREILEEPDIDPVELEVVLRKKFGDKFKGYSGKDLSDGDIETPEFEPVVTIPPELRQQLARAERTEPEKEKPVEEPSHSSARSASSPGSEEDDFSDILGELADADDKEEDEEPKEDMLSDTSEKSPNEPSTSKGESSEEEEEEEEEEDSLEREIEKKEKDLEMLENNIIYYREESSKGNDIMRNKMVQALEQTQVRRERLLRELENLKRQRHK